MSDSNVSEISSVDPSAHLPLLSQVVQMERKERSQALALWVNCFNSHRDKISPELERELDHVLEVADREDVDVGQIEKLQNGIDQWLESAGQVGEGRGPDEPESPPLDR